ncbi:MAG: hypothetical protein M3680_22495 [Myxococcota bacterium]|nr:hypothetical protein [Myxococcota bacterium]
MDVIEQRLPDRSEEEERALATCKRALESAEKKLNSELRAPLPGSDRGRLGRQERVEALQRAINERRAALVTMLDELAAARLGPVPTAAPDVENQH